MHPKHKWEMPFKSKFLRAYIRVVRIIRIVRFRKGGWPINIYHFLGMNILGQQMH